jgi:hypothetical protein
MKMSKERKLLKKILATGWLNNTISCEVEELLAQPEQEPVAWIWEQQSHHSGEWDSEFAEGKPQNFRAVRNIRPLYTSPQKREPLSDRLTANMFNANKKATSAACYWAGVSDAEKHHGIGG